MQNKILILTDDCHDADILKVALTNSIDGTFKVEWARKLAAGIKLIDKGGIDAIIVDSLLPDSCGIATFDQLYAVAPHIPIMMLCEKAEEELAVEAVKRGAQGYLAKGHFVSSLVPLTMRNSIQRKMLEQAFYKEKTRAEIALNSISDAVLCTDISGKVDYLNIAAEKITGWSREEAQGKPIAEIFNIINGTTREHDQNPVKMVLQEDEPRGLNADTVLIRRDGIEVSIEDSVSPIHDWNGKLTGAVIVFHDVSETQAMTMKMAHLAQHDFLTNLPNRVLLNDRIAQAITLAKRENTQFAVLFLDLDNFKHINDSLGHATGDLLLQSVAKSLNDCVRGSDTVSRQGGDEFVILLAGGKYGEDAVLTADKILAELTLSHSISLADSIAKNELHITTSIGISVYPDDGEDAETLIKNADTAMYWAKEKGRNNYQFFRTEMNVRAVERQFVEANLRLALEREEFLLLYQPKVNLDTGMITGAEVLLRWQHPEWGLVLPKRFVTIAEDCGLIVPIGRWVLCAACRQAKEWLDAGLLPISIAVNISTVEFHQKNFVERVRAILEDTGLDAGYLELEITESVLMRDGESSTEILQQLKDMGVQLAVDDFGTGYSSLSYLQRFPIDVLKIDRSFVHAIGSTKDDGIIVSAVIAMGNSLKLRVVAEGVENQEQLEFIKARFCEEGQGHIFSLPLTASNFAALLASPVVMSTSN
ncbi:MAG TPA: EAL domain-containing protein [Methylophilaceae bacterium]|nr:EAL domain-containing protein [Methylophilaceae bacterium]